MRNMSFSMTKPQVRSRIKTVTRRHGWINLKKGDLLRAVEKGMGLKAGEKVVQLAIIRVVDVRSEQLRKMTDNEEYGRLECQKEGFGDDQLLCQPLEFVRFFCKSHKGCMPDTEVSRIEFEYVD